MPSVPAAGVPERVPFGAKVTAEGRAPVSLKEIGLSPFAVTLKFPASVAVNLVLEPEVNTGAVALTVRVKA